MKKLIGIASLLAFGLAATPVLAAGERVPAGTTIYATLATQTDLSTKSSQIGDGFTLRVRSANEGDRDLRGAVVRGHVANVRSAGQGRAAILSLAFDSITFPNGHTAPLSAVVTQMGGKSDNTTARQALGAGAGAAVGSQTVGRIIGGSAGSVVGLLGGAVGGLAYARNNKPNYDLAPGQSVTLQTQNTLYVPRRQAGQ
ncbi:MAG: hypothetical protein IAI49_12160 [Candidatus Eremiobacteraeota bacterium]|nr:hypothetical protein [Candidatus Eremiobacteraeota bacterium]